MSDLPVEYASWLAELPSEYDMQVVIPLRFETHEDDMAHARKVVGWADDGQRCYVRHVHTLTEERFDIDEFPLLVPVVRERQVAWRLADGRWLHLHDRTDRLESCQPRRVAAQPVVVSGGLVGL